MISFLKVCGKFSVLNSFFLFLLVVVIHLLVRACSDFKLHRENVYVLLGNSHAECSINDDLIIDFKNLANSGESYFYTYFKVKELLKDNSLKGVLIEFNNTAIKPHVDEWVWGFEKMNYYFPVYAPFMGAQDLLLLYTMEKVNLFRSLSTSTRKNFTKILSFDYDLGVSHGGFLPVKKQMNDDELEKTMGGDVCVDETVYSEVNISYLKRIVELCKKNDIDIYFLRSPQHKSYCRSNEKLLMEIKENEFSEIPFLDFDNFPIENTGFADLSHLNQTGAKKFSKSLNLLIKGGVFCSDDLEGKIMEYMDREYSE